MVFKPKNKKPKEETEEISDEPEEEEEEEIEEPKTSKVKPKKIENIKEIAVVNELPTQPVKTFIDETTEKEIEFVTRDEALKEILVRLRKLDEGD